MNTIYNAQVFIRAAADYQAGVLQFIEGFDAPTIAARHAAESAALACDDRIPASCMGYVSDLTSGRASGSVVRDRIAILSRFVEFAG